MGGVPVTVNSRVINAREVRMMVLEEYGEKKMGRILFIDVDGTLVNYENHLPDSAVDAIRKARANGHRAYICTGRSKAEVYPPLWEIGLDGMIGGNGAYVEDEGLVVIHKLITAAQCRHIVDWLHGRGLEFYLESNNGLFSSEHFEEKAQRTIKEYVGRKGVIRQMLPSVQFFRTWFLTASCIGMT